MRVVGWLAILSLSACVSTNATMLGGAKPDEPIDPQTVVIYRTAAQAPVGYREVALIHATADSGFSDERRLYDAMRREAARIGANGVLLDGGSSQSAEISSRAIAIVVSPTADGAK